jgi:meso-butanediol dehydrogenase / (S,S)-butanediol dehydrogenase / diacetyl reductase
MSAESIAKATAPPSDGYQEVTPSRQLPSLTKAIAVRYGRSGIRANAIAPATIRTPIWQRRLELDPQVFERLTKWYPLGRVGEPEDVANTVL